jgi:cytochrome P450
MELFRVISPNDGSYSTLRQSRATLRQPRAAFAAMFSGAVTPHAAASMNPRHWKNPTEFDPDRYKTAPTSLDNDAARAQQIGFAQCPFPVTSFAVKDGRKTEMVNSAFGAVYPVVDGKAHPVCDTAGFAPFGFGYRRCGGEHLTIEFVKEFLRAVWRNRISFVGLDIAEPRKTPVNPGTVLNDDIAFERKA